MKAIAKWVAWTVVQLGPLSFVLSWLDLSASQDWAIIGAAGWWAMLHAIEYHRRMSRDEQREGTA